MTSDMARNMVTKVAIRMIGIFFGKAGTFEAMAREITRTSVGVASSESRALASRYFAR